MKKFSNLLFLIEELMKNYTIKDLKNAIKGKSSTVEINGIKFLNVHFCKNNNLLIFRSEEIGKYFNLIQIGKYHFAKAEDMNYNNRIYYFTIKV